MLRKRIQPENHKPIGNQSTNNKLRLALRLRKWMRRLEIVWIFSLLYGELLAGYVSVMMCRWPAISNYRLLILADPQLTDWYSYRMTKGSWVLKATEFYSDIYMKKNFRAIMQNMIKPTGVLILGDLFDGGRLLDDAEFQDHLHRFHRIFSHDDTIDFFNMTGNHDVGISRWFNPHAMERFEKTFGKTNYVVRAGKFDLVVIDAIGLVSPGKSVESEAWSFIKSLEHGNMRPRILFTHIPLYRDNDIACGPRRSKRPIEQWRGISYQNLLSNRTTHAILETIKPSYIFSGDDHSPCLHEHRYFNRRTGQIEAVKEYTVATFSWLQGERQPEFVMVSLDEAAMAVEICDLPNQLRIYKFYAALGFMSALTIFAFVISQRRGASVYHVLPVTRVKVGSLSLQHNAQYYAVQRLVFVIVTAYGVLLLISHIV